VNVVVGEDDQSGVGTHDEQAGDTKHVVPQGSEIRKGRDYIF